MNKLFVLPLSIAAMAAAAGCELVNTGDDNSVDTEIQDNHSVNTGDSALIPAEAATNETAVAE